MTTVFWSSVHVILMSLVTELQFFFCGVQTFTLIAFSVLTEAPPTLLHDPAHNRWKGKTIANLIE